MLIAQLYRGFWIIYLFLFLGKNRQIPLSDIFAEGTGNNTITPEEILVSVHIPHSKMVRY